MTIVFLICAAVGGTILVVQFLLLLIGLGGEALHIDVPSAVGHDLGGDFGGGFHGDVGGGFDGDVGAGFHGDIGAGLHGDVGAGLHGDGGADVPTDAGAAVDHGGDVATDHHVSSSWLFSVLSVRTVVAALAFFGLGGLGAEAAGAGTLQTLVVAVAAGLLALYGVYYLLLCIARLAAEGTVRVQRAIGRHGTVYTTIPGKESGTGKIQINLQNRTMEYLALTSGHALSPGAKVVVTEVITSDTVAVEPVLETEKDNSGPWSNLR
jgi:hypothetical protein